MKAKLFYFISLLSFVTLVGCSDSDNTGDPDPLPSGDGMITLSADKQLIAADGVEKVTFTAIFTDPQGNTRNVTSSVEIYYEGNETPIEGNTFVATQAGEYSFYALYGLLVSNDVKVTVVGELGELPADPNPASTSFPHRILLLQHTGTGCPNCPRIMTLLKSLADDTAYAGRYQHVASHSYNTDDKAYSSAAALLSRTTNVLGYYPWVTYNYATNNMDDDLSLSGIQASVDALHKAEADAGISAVSQLVGSKVYVRVGVKAAKSDNYRVAVWLLEDNIQATQSGATASWQHTHNNCLREMAGENKTDRIYGSLLNNTVEAGQSVEYTASLTWKESWNSANCKVMVLLSAKNEAGDWDLVNCAVCPLGGSVAYEYNETL